MDVLLADTTGEMLKLMNGADVVIMGKSLAGHDEGHNLIEPALLRKPIVTGPVLRNFRMLLKLLHSGGGLLTVEHDGDLTEVLAGLFRDPERRRTLGETACALITANRGAAEKSIAELKRLTETGK